MSKTEVIDSMDNHDEGLFSNQLDQLNQLVNTNEIIVCLVDYFWGVHFINIIKLNCFTPYRNGGK